MRRWLGMLVMVGLLLGLAALPALAQDTGRIEGQLMGEGGANLSGVTVALEGGGADRATITDSNGRFSFESVPAGSYTLRFNSGSEASTSEVSVEAGATTSADEQLPWDPSFAESITVYSASRQTERITEAPAAISVISEQQIERMATSGQVPKLLEQTPGAEVTQSGLYDFNFNTRGFNSSLNRRILTLVDGRDPSVPFLGSQEWSAVTFPLDDLASVELVRGPGSALYGADAFNGVLNMVTKAPRFSEGGKVKLTGGDLDTLRGDLRVAGALGDNTYFKVTGGYMESEDFSKSRNPASGGPEYKPCAPGQEFDCLAPEPVPLALTENELTFGGARIDQYLGGGGAVLTFEAGTAEIEGPVAQTGIGRVQLLDVARPWARVNLNTVHWNVLGYWNSRDATDQLALRSGAQLVLDSENYAFEVQGNSNFANQRGRLVGGASYKEEEIDSANDQGFQTLMFGPVSEDFTGVFGQLEYNFTDALKAVVALRWDDSSLHDSQTSPRGSLVWAVTPNHSLRATYAEAFQTPNYSEFFLVAPVAPSVTALGPLEEKLAPVLGDVPLKFDSIPVLALGNNDVEVEEITSYELGYTGIFGPRTYMTLDYYQNDIENFITDLIGPFQAELGGRINPNFGAYTPPAQLPAQIQQFILLQLAENLPASLLAILSNAPNGDPIFAAATYTNFGEVETQGIELGFHHNFTRELGFDFSYAWFDFDVQTQLAADPVSPNSPESQFSLGLNYVTDRWDASIGYRWVEDFRWAAGVFQGNIPEYEVVSLAGNYHFNDSWGIGIDISNALDDEHYQAFGGDILERRALVHASYSW